MSKYHFLLSKPGSNKETAVASATARARVALRSVFFSDWLPFLSAVCVKHGEEAEGRKKKKNKTNNTDRRVATPGQSQLSVCGLAANGRRESA